MDARIRATRAVDDDARADNLRERFLQKILHPIASRLALPAAEFTAVVDEEEFEPQILHCDVQAFPMSGVPRALCQNRAISTRQSP